jgi:chaperonin cofactor prefoldin
MCFTFIFLFAIQSVSAANNGSFTQQDRELLIRLDERMNQIDKRFEQIDKRFEQVDKRFELIDKRFEQVDKRFDQIDKRIGELRQDMNNRFEQLMTLLWIVTSVFASLVAAIIGFALWDRHTMLKQARIEFEKGSGLNALLEAARKFAEKNKDFKEALQSVKLL